MTHPNSLGNLKLGSEERQSEAESDREISGVMQGDLLHLQ
jgi:hypothetical protein